MQRKYVRLVSAATVLLTAASLLADAPPASAPVVLDLGGDQYRVTWTFRPPSGARTIHLAGTFNEWNPQALALEGPDESGVFRVSQVLPKGRHEYKFVLDGQTWVSDPGNPHQTAGYANSILYLGVPPPDEPAAQPPPPQPVVMAGEVDHPPAVAALADKLRKADAAEIPRLARDWFSEHPQPLFSGEAVSFVHLAPSATDANLQILAYGARTGYRMRRLVEDRPVFAVSLERSKLPERAAYLLEVVTPSGSSTIVDPQAWSITSRADRPAGAIVEASAQRGRIEVIRDVKPSAGDLRQRDLYVYLPPGYDREKERRYPVLYMHDGQNCWDDPTQPFGHGGWCVNLTADRLIAEGKVKPFLVVGLANTADRMNEYGPGPDILSDAQHAYLQFLKRDVLPLISGRYRTLSGPPNTALMGSSLGGVISLEAALLAPEVYGQAACLSPAFVFKDAAGRDYPDLLRKVGRQPVRLYLDSGTAGEGQDGAPRTRAMVELLRSTGWKDGADLLHYEDAGAEHNERAWRARLDRPLVFLFGTSPP